MSRSISESPLDFEITRADCNLVTNYNGIYEKLFDCTHPYSHYKIKGTSLLPWQPNKTSDRHKFRKQESNMANQHFHQIRLILHRFSGFGEVVEKARTDAQAHGHSNNLVLVATSMLNLHGCLGVTLNRLRGPVNVVLAEETS